MQISPHVHVRSLTLLDIKSACTREDSGRRERQREREREREEKVTV
jgi:hypothetical protein